MLFQIAWSGGLSQEDTWEQRPEGTGQVHRSPGRALQAEGQQCKGPEVRVAGPGGTKGRAVGRGEAERAGGENLLWR